VGVNQNKMRFLEAFLALCLLKDSPPIAPAEQAALDENHVIVARRGREPRLALGRNGHAVPMLDWARELIDAMQGLCEVLDTGDAARPYAHALAAQAAKIEDVELTPSARLLAEMTATREPFLELARRVSATHKSYFVDLYTPNRERLQELAAEADGSLARQKKVEASDREPFEAYLSRYFAD
jgi:glutamate--cysteine ligase